MADATLAMWEEKLKNLRKVTSVRSLNKEMHAPSPEPAVRVRAYRNGVCKSPVLVIGSTIHSVSFQ